MELDVGVLVLERGPLALGLLDAILAERAVAGREGGANELRRMGLADGDQRHVGGLAPGRPDRSGDATLNRGKVGGDRVRRSGGHGLRPGMGHGSVRP